MEEIITKLILALAACISFNVFAEYDLDKVRRALKARMHNTEVVCEETYNKAGKSYPQMNVWHTSFIDKKIDEDFYQIKVTQSNDLEEEAIANFVSRGYVYKFYLSSDLNYVVSLEYEFFIPHAREVVEGNILTAEFREIVDKTYRLKIKCSVTGGSYSESEL